MPLRVGDAYDDRQIYGVIEVCVNLALSPEEARFCADHPGLSLTRKLVLWLPFDEGSSAPFSFKAGSKYALTVTAYTLDGSTATQAVMVIATA
ncbi:MAG: hypothetical protein NWF09_05105 [Candidatus Bathyarchaeota archaeon]|nr:hypothetical protein [Candidatus Bathyarchaeota archaeon]